MSRTWFTYHADFAYTQTDVGGNIPARTFRFAVRATGARNDDELAAEAMLARKIENHIAPYYPDRHPLRALITSWGDVVIVHLDSEIARGEVAQA